MLMEFLWEEHIVEIWVFRQVVRLEEFLFEYFEPWFFFPVDIPWFDGLLNGVPLFGLCESRIAPVSYVHLILLAVTGHEFWVWPVTWGYRVWR